MNVDIFHTIGMITFGRHIQNLGRVVVAFFLLSTSGFTTVLHICTMTNAGCCDQSEESDHKACHEEESLPASGISISDGFACHLNLVAGGTNDVQGLVEKTSNPPHPVKVDFLAVGVLPAGDASFLFPNRHLLVSKLKDPSPPSVEKYVLNETFLI